MTNIIYYYGIIFIITRIHTLFSRKTIEEVENKEILKTTLEDSLNTIKKNNLLPQFIMVCLNFLWVICGIIFTQQKTIFISLFILYFLKGYLIDFLERIMNGVILQTIAIFLLLLEILLVLIIYKNNFNL